MQKPRSFYFLPQHLVTTGHFLPLRDMHVFFIYTELRITAATSNHESKSKTNNDLGSFISEMYLTIAPTEFYCRVQFSETVCICIFTADYLRKSANA